MNIQDFKFYRKNNRYYFESHELEGKIGIRDNLEVYGIEIENGEATDREVWNLIEIFQLNITAVLAAESL